MLDLISKISELQTSIAVIVGGFFLIFIAVLIKKAYQYKYHQLFTKLLTLGTGLLIILFVFGVNVLWPINFKLLQTKIIIPQKSQNSESRLSINKKTPQKLDFNKLNNSLNISDGNSVNLSTLVKEYKAGEGLQLDGKTFSLTNKDSDGTYGSKTKIPQIKVDKQGRILDITEKTVDFADTVLTEQEVDDYVANNGYLLVEVDGSTTNELNTSFLLSGDNLTVTDQGGSLTVDLSHYITNNESINELGDVSTPTPANGSVLTWNNITSQWEAGSPSAGNTDNQQLSLNNATNIVTLSNGTGADTTIDLTQYLDNTDNQDLTLTGNTLALTNDASTVDLSPYLDNTDAQTLSIVGHTISLTNGGSVVVPDNDTTYTAGTGLSLTGTVFALNSGIDNLTDVDTTTTAPTNGQVLSWDGANWVPANNNEHSGTEGSIFFANNTNGEPTEDSANLFWRNGSNRLGIRTNTPTQALDINGSMILSGNDRNIYSGSRLNIAGDSGIDFIVDNDNNSTNLSHFRFKRNGDGAETLMIIREDGTVGIGDTTPDALLDVAGSFRLDGTFADASGDVGTAGQILSSTAVGTDWINASSLALGSIDNHSDVDTTTATPTNGQVLSWDGGNWVPANDNNTTYSAGTGLNLVGTIFNLSDTAVTTGSYGSATQTATFTVDQQGRLTAAGNTTITPAWTSITGRPAGLDDGDDDTTYSNGNGLNLTGTTFSVNSPTCSGTDKLQWNGTSFVCLADVDTDTTYSAGTGLALSGTTFSLNSGIDNLIDVDTTTTAPTNNQVLAWNGSNWVPANDNDTTYTAGGTLLNLSGTTFSIDEGTLTNNRLCTYVSGTGLVCNTDPSTVGSTTFIGLTDTPSGYGTNGYLVQTNGSNALTYINPTTLALGSINQHSDVDTTTTAPTNGNLLTWNGSNWVPTSSTNYTDNIYTANGTLGGNRTVTLNGHNLYFIGGGNVGVGTNSPSELLDVNGNTRIRGFLYDGNNQQGTIGQILSSTATGIDWIDQYITATGSALTVTGQTISALFDNSTIGVNGSSQLYVLDSGIDTLQLADDAVTNIKIADNAVDSRNYVDDSIDDAHINWGTGVNQVSAEDVPIQDAGNYYDQTNVEDVLQHLGSNANKRWSTGLISGGTISDAGGNDINISAGSGFINNATNKLKEVSWSAFNSVNMPYDGDNFIYIDDSGSTHITATESNSDDYIYLGYVYTVGGNTDIGMYSSNPFHSGNYASKNNNWMDKVAGVMVESGNIVSEGSTNLHLVITSGTLNSRLSEFSTADSTSFTKWYKNGSWTQDTNNPNTVNTSQYNSIGVGLVNMTAGYWKKDLVLRTLDGNVHYIYGQAEYATQDEAKQAALPTIPDSIGKAGATYLATIVSQEGDTGIANRLADIRPNMPRVFGFGTSGTTGSVADHGNLVGLGDDDHHQYLRVDGARAMTGNLNLGNNSITDIDNINMAGLFSNINTATQMQIGYDSSNYYTTMVNATGRTTLDAVGINPEFLLNDNVSINGTLTTTGNTSLNGNIILGDNNLDTIVINAILQGGAPLVLEGTTVNSFETTLAVADPTADRTITIPNLSGIFTTQATNLTNGSVLFADGSGQVSQNNSDFFWDNGNSRLEISNLAINGGLMDANNDFGNAGQILSSTATGTDWIDAGTLSLGSIDNHSDVDTTTNTPTNGDLLTWNGSNWVTTSSASYTNNIYTADGTLAGDRTVSLNGNDLYFVGSGNVGIGTTSPVNKLQVNGNVRATRFVASNGTAGSPAFRFNSDSDTGMFRATTNQLAFTTGGNERMRIDNNGRVGIGTGVPDSMLQVNGNTHINRDLKVEDSAIIYTQHEYKDEGLNGEVLNWNLLQTQKTDDPNDRDFATITSGTGYKQTFPITRWKIGDEGSNGQHYGYVGYFPDTMVHDGAFRVNTAGHEETDLILGAGTRDVMYIDNHNFYVGLGTDAPDQLLDVAGNMRLQNAFYDRNNQSGTAGQILSSTVNGTDWIDASGLALGSIDNHSDVDTTTTAPTNGDLLTWDGTNWVTTSATNYTNNIYTADGTLTGNRTVSLNGNDLYFVGSGNVGIGTNSPLSRFDIANHIAFDRGDGNVANGSDIWFDAQGLLSSDSNMLFNIDADNNSTSEYFKWSNNSDSTTGATELMRLTEGLGLDVANHEAIGANSNISNTQTLRVSENYNLDATTQQIVSSATVTSPTLTADRASYGGYFYLVNNKTEDIANGHDSDGVAVYGFTQTTGTNTFRYNRGGFFEARNASNATSNLGNLYGVVGIARQFATDNNADVGSIVGMQGQGVGYTGSSTTAGDITTAYGLYGNAYPYKSDMISAYGVYGYTATNNGYDGDITNAYGVRGQVRVDSDDGGDITHAYGGSFTVTKRTGANNTTDATALFASIAAADTAYAGRFYATSTDAITNYGLYVGAGNASANNYGIYGEQGDWLLDEDGDGIAGGTGPGGDLFLGESQDLAIYHNGTNSYIQNDTGDLIINGNNHTHNLIINNFDSIGVGTVSPSYDIDVDRTGTNPNRSARLRLRGSSSGYTNAALILQAATDTNYRGLGVLMHDEGGDTEWFAGRPYADSDKYIIARLDSVANVDESVAQTSNALLTVQNDGNVGIGIPVPTDTLHVAGSLRVEGALKDNNNSAGTTGQVLTATATGFEWQNPTSCVMGGAKIQGDGTVTNSYGIISSVNRTNTGRYTVNFSQSINTDDYYAHLSKEESTSTRDDVNIDVSAYNANNINVIIHEGDNGTSANTYRDRAFSVTLFDANCTALSAVASSDRRLKKNIENIEPETALDKVLKLQGVSYKWDTTNHPFRRGMDNKPEIGFIAQDVQKVLPEVVNVEKDGYLSLEYGKIMAVTVEAIKDIWDNIENNQQNIVDIQQDIQEMKEERRQLSDNITTLTDLSTQITATLENHEQRIVELENKLADLNIGTVSDTQNIGENDNSQVKNAMQDFAENLKVIKKDGEEISFDLKGNLTVKELTAEKITTGEIVIDNKKDEQSVGRIIIPAGETSIKVESKLVDDKSHIILTPHQPVVVGLGKIKDGKSFEIELKDALDKDLEVEWLIVLEK